ncbi:hypothetical protein [Paraburkholderia megapolitana]|uniref:hypothetical protein n=1 Tax=Paraburkholderia megapolitana TaxID=420953 RepID=UPI0038BC7ED5
MKTRNRVSQTILAATLAGGALLAASSAFAQAVVVEQPQMMPVGVQINIGWHGDRYWDGHRYWAHDEWMHRHPHDRDPRRDHDRRP